jgi:hypothetical protein
LSEQGYQAGELDETEEILRMVLLSDEDAPLPLNPGEEPFDQPAPQVSAQAPSILRGRPAAVRTVRREHLRAVLGELLVKMITASPIAKVRFESPS